ncbi:MAG: ion transporter [Bacteroidales bacterium]|nr:ion transporter [Bacteroidales bacterium]
MDWAYIRGQLNRVFDDRLETRQWENKVDWAIIGLIIISTVEVFLSTFDSISLRYGGWLRAIDIFTTAVFTVEVTLRIWCADLLDPKYKGFWGRVRYCLSFYGLIDIVSTYSFYLALLFPVPYSALKVLRVFRLLRVFRYMKSFRLLGDAFRSKRRELWISLQFLCIVTLILSFLLFFVEHQAQPEVYDNGWRSVLWAFMQYIGDPGGFADTPPVTFWGRVIAVLVGVLGIAIFAVPAGLIGSGFIETIEESRKQEELAERRNLLYQRFESQHSKRKLLLMSDDGHPRSAPARYLSVDYLRSICMLTDNEILEAVRSSDDMRLRPMKSDENLRANDLTVVERHLRSNTSYGYRRWDENRQLVLVNPIGATEHGISHLMATFDENCPDCNIISREHRLYGAATELNQLTGECFAKMEVADKDAPEALSDYVADLGRIRRGQRVLILTSGASGRADIEVQWGMPTGTESYRFDGAHVADGDRQWVESFCERLRTASAEVTVHSAARKDFTFNFSFTTHGSKCFGLEEERNHIARAIFNHSGASVVVVYLNVKTVLKAPDERYYAALKVLMDTLEALENQ